MMQKLVILFTALLISSFLLGQSNIGHWSNDEVDLPVYNYTGEIPYKAVATDGNSVTYPEDPWFLLGNYGITAFVHTSGIIDLYTLRRAWGRVNAETDKSAASIAKISIGGNEHIITGIDSKTACSAQKEFGTGFASFSLTIDNVIECKRTISTLPSTEINKGISALLISVELKNTGKQSQSIKYSESVLANYQMIDEARISYAAKPVVSNNFAFASFTPHTDVTINSQAKDEASTYDFYPPQLFIKGDSKALYKIDGNNIIAENSVSIKQGESKILSFVVGYKFDDDDINAMSSVLVNKAENDSKFRKAWKDKLPDYSYQKDLTIKREQYWNTYVLEASAKYNTYFNETFIPQGMTYDYVWGLNAVARDHLHYSLPANYFNPNLSKSIIRFVLKTMNPSGYFHYNVNGYGYSVPNLWSPSDLQLHLIWAVAEYLKETNDYAFLTEETNFYPKRINYSASVIEKLTIAFNYLNDEISVGPHGLVRMLNADWNDQVWHGQPLTIYYGTAESHYNSSMSIVVLKELIEELKKASESPILTKQKSDIDNLISKMSLFRNNQLNAFITDLGDRDFVKRAYYDKTLSLGDSSMHIESQLYTLMIDEIPLEQKIRIVEQIEKRLMNNEVLGVRTSEVKTNDVFKAGTHENGGIWQYIQGMYSIGLLNVDAEKADKLIKQMSFDNFAANYPDYWPGQWTGADCVNSSLAKNSGLVSNNGSVYMNFPAYCTHIHSWPLLYQFKRVEYLENNK